MPTSGSRDTRGDRKGERKGATGSGQEEGRNAKKSAPTIYRDPSSDGGKIGAAAHRPHGQERHDGSEEKSPQLGIFIHGGERKLLPGINGFQNNNWGYSIWLKWVFDFICWKFGMEVVVLGF